MQHISKSLSNGHLYSKFQMVMNSSRWSLKCELGFVLILQASFYHFELQIVDVEMTSKLLIILSDVTKSCRSENQT